MNFTNMKIKDFIDNIINYDNIDDIFNLCVNQSEKGFIFERLYDIIIKLNYCNLFDNYYHLIGNSNNGKLHILNNINKYFNNEFVISGNSSGCSDITLKNKNDDSYIFISSKYPKNDKDIINEKSIEYYDIQNIIAMADENKYIYEKYKIFLLVPNKKKLLEKVKYANISSKYITKHIIENNILDKSDLEKYFLKFKSDIIKYKKINNNINYNHLYLNPKEKLNLRFHQELITFKTSDLIDNGHKSFLWGCKCRSGKTFMTGGLIIKEFNKNKKLNVLIITPAPSETIPQFTNDLFDKYEDFDKFKIHEIENSKMLLNLKLEDNNIFIISKQLLQKYINDNVIKEIYDLKLNLIIFDENHFSGTTDLSKDILLSYAHKNTVKIYLTATFNKPLKKWHISEECKMFWDIEDEQICKSILIDENNINKLKEKHGNKYIDKTLEYYNTSLNKIFKCYQNMPDLHLITTIFDNEKYEIIKNKIMNSKYGFCFDVLFSLTNDKKRFNYYEEIKLILRYITGSNKEVDYKNGDKSIFSRIKKISSRHPFIQIWFLPSDNINEISKCLINLMEEDDVLKDYDIMCINRKNKNLPRDIKDEINKQEIISRKTKKKGLILLAGNMLNLGITIKSCDVVILMNNSLSSDKVLQQMYRCMTEDENKKMGFVVDLNISRVLNTCINYTIYKNNDNIESKIKYLIENNLINIDIDMIDNKKLNSDIIIKKLMDIWKNDPINSFKSLLKNLDNDYIDFDNYTQKLINNTFKYTLKDKNHIDTTIEFVDDGDILQELPSGKEITKINEYEIKEKKEKEEIETKISFTKDVLPYIIPLTCILTIKDKNKDFVKMLNDIKENKTLLEIFDDQCLIWWNKKCLISFIQEIINEYFDKSSNTYNISIQFKMSLESLIDKPKELLELINDCLKPKEIEKKIYGEVFTPMKLVNEMLDKLPLEVWNNKNLKWFDPCVGMGNFMIAVYLRLMEQLKNEIIDENERKKHIIENMIYMSELNKKNVFICNQIFNINNNYKLNLYQGDSLKINYYDIFKIKKFDIIIGNPPYQDDSGNKGKGHTLWTKFVELSLDKLLKNNGYLVFIHPSVWRQIEHPLLNKIKNKQILYLEIHNSDDGMKIFKCATRYDWYVLHNIDNYQKTIIKDEERIINNIDLKKWDFIPNMMFDKLHELIFHNHEKLDVNYYRSNYGTEKNIISKDKNNEFKYPVIYSINKNNILSLRYSNTNKNGHFNLSKFIFSNGAGFYCDNKGEYGLTEWAYCIYDEPEILPLIEKTFRSNDFNKIKKALIFDSKSFNIKVMKLFKKDFYKDFINDYNDNNEIKNKYDLLNILFDSILLDIKNYKL
jgi:hypothetical protein